MAKNNQKNANLRVCASCEWIFKKSDHNELAECPKCKFGSYGAKFAYGNKAYRYSITQSPWMDRKLGDFHYELFKEVTQTNQIKEKTDYFL